MCDRLTSNSLKPDPAKVNPIVEYITSKEQANVARFLAMVKYLARYTENLSQRTFHMRSLLKANVVFTWGQEDKKEFNGLKKLLWSQLLIQFYNPQLPMKISCDGSKKGLAAIFEQHYEDPWLSVSYTSRVITETQSPDRKRSHGDSVCL